MGLTNNSSRFRFVTAALCGGLLLSGLSEVSLAQSGLTGDSGSGVVRKKLIDRGWGAPTVEDFIANIDQIDASFFDGVGMKFSVVDDEGKVIPCFMGGTSQPWKPEWFLGKIKALKAIKSDKLKESFFSTSIAVSAQKFTDVFDDEGWKNIIEHYRIAAWVAKQTGMKGVMFDLESYSASPLNYKSGKTDKSFDEYAAKVRQRGREMMEAMAKEYPDMTLFTLFLYSGGAMSEFGGDPRPNLELGHENYNLMPAFLNGWLDAAPPGIKIVDGMEHSYPHSTEVAFLRRVNAARNTAISLVAEENRAKYRAQVQAGLAIYLDAFISPINDVHSDVYIDPPLEGSVADRIRQTTMDALDVVDEYVWIFHEQYRFWPTSNPNVQAAYWNDIFPGVTTALAEAKDLNVRRTARADKEFKIYEHKSSLRNRPLRNLLKDPNFLPPAKVAKSKAGEPAPEIEVVWNSQGEGGTLSRRTPTLKGGGYQTGWADPGMLSLAGTKEGAWTQEVAVDPSKFYKARVKVRQVGKGSPQMQIIWMDSNGQKVGSAKAVPTASPNEGWQTVELTAAAPANAVKALFSLEAKAQPSDSDLVWYDNAELYRIGVN